jgi:hypothetical protein
MTQDDFERFSSFGSYTPAQFFARISEPAALDGLGPEGATVLMHEYWHYLQNVSTLVGLKAFITWQSLLVPFSKTLQARADGSSVGSAALTADEYSQIKQSLEVHMSVRGDRTPKNRERSEDIVSRVTAIDGRAVTLSLAKRGYDIGPATYMLGTVAIEESIAWLVEREASAMFSASVPPPPEFPYRTLERLAEHVLDRQLEGPVLAGLGTLSLLSNAPGERLVPLLRAFGRIAAREGDLAALRQLAAGLHPLIRAFREKTRVELSNLVEMHRGRGLSERAMVHYAKTIDRALELRCEDPLFDLAPFLGQEMDSDTRRGRLTQLIAELPPCDVEMPLKDETGGVVRSMVTFDPQPDPVSGLALSQHLRAFQAQLHHVVAHLRTGTPVASSSVPPTHCPFLASCTHPLQKIHPEICKANPWMHVNSPEPLCWYASGISASLGTVKIRASAPK